MIAIYCRGRHGSSGQLCGECEKCTIVQRLERCPFGDCPPVAMQRALLQERHAAADSRGDANGRSRMLLLHPIEASAIFTGNIRETADTIPGAKTEK